MNNEPLAKSPSPITDTDNLTVDDALKAALKALGVPVSKRFQALAVLRHNARGQGIDLAGPVSQLQNAVPGG